MFFGEKERNLVKQVNDELAERVLGQTIAYYPISIEESNFSDVYGEAKEKVSLPPVRVFAYVVVANEQTNEKFGYEYQTKLTVNFHRRRLVEDQNLFVRVGDFVQYGEEFYEIVRTYNDTRYLFGQVEHKFQIAAECVKARQGVFRVMPGITRPTTDAEVAGEQDNPAPRSAPYPPLAASYITVNADPKLPNERVLTAGSGITLTDGGANSTLTIAASGQNAVGPTGSLQFQEGAGVFSGSSGLTFLAASNRLGIGTATPGQSLTIVGDMSMSSTAKFGGDVYVAGTLIGGSPLKVSGSIDIYNGDPSTPTVVLGGTNGSGKTTISASCFEGTDILVTELTASRIYAPSLVTGSANTSGSFLAVDSNNNIILATASAGTAGNPGGANNQIQINNSGEFGASANLTFNGSTLLLSGGLTHRRTAIATSHTASVSEYILGVTGVPTSILVDATSFSDGQVLVVKDESGVANGTNTITVNPSGSQTIDGATSATIESPFGSILVYSNGSNWFIY
tara:strand:+ start:2279 stop:3811 length:1533 start_codon:yes stop_codon:yes gene_type:complete